MRRAYLLLLLAFLTLPFFFASCATVPDFWADAKPTQKKVLVSFPPLYCITHAVGGDDTYVLCMLTTQGPHDYVGVPTDSIKAAKADLYICNGLTLDDDFSRYLYKNRRKGSLPTLNIGAVMEDKHAELLLGGKGHFHADGGFHPAGEHDPHIWLGLKRAIVMTEIIAAKLADIDPANAEGYEKRAAEFIAKLKELQTYGQAALAKKKDKKIITMHQAFDYFLQEFGMEAAAIQMAPGADPDAAHMAKLAELCQKEKISVIAVEPQYSHAQAEALQRDLKHHGLDIKIITLDPLETAPVADRRFNPDPNYYLTKMRENIDTLAKALP
jgi:zinc transport system substrate-binding protein